MSLRDKSIADSAVGVLVMVMQQFNFLGRSALGALTILGTVVGLTTWWLLGLGLAQASSSEAAVKLLRLSLECPIEPETFDFGMPGHEITTTHYLGDDRTMKIRIVEETRLHDPETNSIVVYQHINSYVAQFSDLEGDVYVSPSESRRHAWDITIECKFLHQHHCISNDQQERFKYHYSETIPDFHLFFCTQRRASDAKLAIDQLIKLNSPATQ